MDSPGEGSEVEGVDVKVARWVVARRGDRECCRAATARRVVGRRVAIAGAMAEAMFVAVLMGLSVAWYLTAGGQRAVAVVR